MNRRQLWLLIVVAVVIFGVILVSFPQGQRDQRIVEVQRREFTSTGQVFSLRNSTSREVGFALQEIVLKSNTGWDHYTNLAAGSGKPGFPTPGFHGSFRYTAPHEVWNLTINPPPNKAPWRFRLLVLQQVGGLARLREMARIYREDRSTGRGSLIQLFSYRPYGPFVQLVTAEIDTLETNRFLPMTLE